MTEHNCHLDPVVTLRRLYIEARSTGHAAAFRDCLRRIDPNADAALRTLHETGNWPRGD